MKKQGTPSGEKESELTDSAFRCCFYKAIIMEERGAGVRMESDKKIKQSEEFE